MNIFWHVKYFRILWGFNNFGNDVIAEIQWANDGTSCQSQCVTQKRESEIYTHFNIL